MKKILFVGDLHLPFAHLQSYALLCKIIRTWRPYAVVLCGDVQDNRALKRHADAPKVFTSLKYDNDMSKQLFEKLDDTCNEAEVVRKGITLGNHDTYMERYLMEEAPALYDYKDILDPLTNLRAEERGWDIAKYHVPLEIGKVSCIHDVDLAGPYAVTRAATLFGGSVVFGHTHAAGVMYTGDMTGERYVAMNVGWLGDPEFAAYMPGYKQARNWTHGVGTGYLVDDGLVFCNFHPFVKNKTVVEGKLITL